MSLLLLILVLQYMFKEKTYRNVLNYQVIILRLSDLYILRYRTVGYQSCKKLSIAETFTFYKRLFVYSEERIIGKQ
jgi:hypothetical protein